MIYDKTRISTKRWGSDLILDFYPTTCNYISYISFTLCCTAAIYWFAGYMMIRGIMEQNYLPIIASCVYLVVLDINTSVPIFSSIIAVLLCYLMVLPRLKIIASCQVCANILLVLSIYLMYFYSIYI